MTASRPRPDGRADRDRTTRDEVGRRLRAWVGRELDNLAPARRYRLALAGQEIERWLEARPDAVVLDAGCQTGQLAVDLARSHPGWQVVAADIDEVSLRQVQQRADRDALGNVHPVCVDLTAPFAAGAFDVVAAIECLAEIPDDRAVLLTLARALRPGGVLCLHVPRAGWRPVLRSSPRQWYDNLRSGYSPEELQDALVGVGLEVVSLRPTTRATVHLAEEVRYRWVRRASPRCRLAAVPFFRAAVWLETHGLTAGSARGLLAVARRPA